AAVGALRLAGGRRAWSADVVDTAAATRLRQGATAAVERVVAAVIESAAILGERCAGARRADGCRDYGAIRPRLVGDEVLSGADDNGAVAGHCGAEEEKIVVGVDAEIGEHDVEILDRKGRRAEIRPGETKNRCAADHHRGVRV